MHVLIIIASILGGAIVLLLLLGIFMRKEHYVKREIDIRAPRQKVFDYIKLLRNQDEFNTGAMAGADRERSYKGTDGTVGFIYAWKGDKGAGEGEKEIRNIVEGKSVEMEIRFVKPMKVNATIIMGTDSLPGDQTRVSWSNAGTLKYPVNILIPLMEKSVAKGMDVSLKTLKDILEK